MGKPDSCRHSTRLRKPTSSGLGQVEVNESAVVARLATLEIRLLEVEKRLNMPPAA